MALPASDERHELPALIAGSALVILAVLALVVWWPTSRPMGVEGLLDVHADAWEARDGDAVAALYVSTGRFVYGDVTYVGSDLAAFVSGLGFYEFEPLADPVVASNEWGDVTASVAAWKAHVTIEHPPGNRMSAEGLALFHIIEQDGQVAIRRFEFVTQP